MVVACEAFASADDFPQPWLSTTPLASALAAVTRSEVLAILPTIKDIQRIVLTGKGQGQIELSAQTRSDVMQALLAAEIIDTPDWVKGVSNSRVAHELKTLVEQWLPSAVEHDDPKTTLQEFAQRFGWSTKYLLVHEDGPDHRRRFTSKVTLQWLDQTFSFVGGEASSKQRAEVGAARTALPAINSLRGDPGALNIADRALHSAVLTSVAERIVTPAGWRRALVNDPIGLNALVKSNPEDVLRSLKRLFELFNALNAQGTLDAFLPRLTLLPTARLQLSEVLSKRVELLRDVLGAVDPAFFAIEHIEELIDECLLLITAARRMPSDERERESDLLRMLEVMEGVGVEREIPLFTTEADAELLSAVVRYSRVKSVRVRRVWSDAAEIQFLDADSGRSELLTDVLRASGFNVQTSDGVAVTVMGDDPLGQAFTLLLRGTEIRGERVRHAAMKLHDLKNLLIAIKTSFFLASSHRDHRFAHFAAIERAVRAACGVAEEIRGLLRGKIELQVSSFSLQSFLDGILRDAPDKVPPGVSIASFFERANVEFEGDSRALRNGVENLLKNSIHAVGPTGDIRLDAIFDPQMAEVLIEISNSGVVPDHVLAAIAAGDMPPSTKHDGVGLGVASVIEVARLHGGSFSLSNRGGRATAALQLPLARSVSIGEPGGKSNAEEAAVGR